MDASRLMERVLSYGADAEGINDRFGDNTELYQICLMDFLSEPNVDALREAIAFKEYKKAFEAAHALKGVSGNLGLTRYYEAICVLVESLRANDYTNVSAEFAETERRFEEVLALTRDAEPMPIPSASAPAEETAVDEDTSAQTINPAVNAPAEEAAAVLPDNKDAGAHHATQISTAAPKKRRRIIFRDLFIPASAGILTLIIMVLLFMFERLVYKYEDNVTTESASHLSEINYQLKQLIEDNIERDWRLTHTLVSFLSEAAEPGSDDSIHLLMEDIQDTWNVSDIYLYTKDGENLCLRGNAEIKDSAIERAARAREYGEYMTIVDSNITYTVPVSSGFKYKGLEIVALSVIKDMKSFLDNMEFSSFGNAAYMYLTDDTGKVFSRLTSDSSKDIFNVSALFDGEITNAITNAQIDSNDILAFDKSTVLISKGTYIVTTPVITRRNNFRLIYFVPENAVNSTSKQFTISVTGTSLVVLLIFAMSAVFIIIYQYRVRKKKFDTALIAREHMFDLLVKNSPTAFAMFRLGETRPLFISGNCDKIMNIADPALLYRDGRYIIEGGGKLPEALNAELAEWDGATPWRSGFIKNPAADPPVYFEAQLFPAEDLTGEYVCVIQDVTQLQNREDEIKTALRLSEQGSEAKTRFLSNMSHDIRTPMNAIINMTDFAMEDLEKPAKLMEYLNVIRDSSGHLLMLINDILEMSRIESGKTEISSAPFDLKKELARLCAIIQPLCEEKAQTFIHNFDALETSYVQGDKLKVSQVLLNILSNAVKFTPNHGAVRFAARTIPSLRDEYICVRFIIEDTGMGMSKEFMEHMFEPFVRADDKRISGVSGTGLGLSICHSYVTAMGGRIKCESEPGDGSLFTVELYFSKTEFTADAETIDEQQGDARFSGMRCLLCEDNPTNRQIAISVLGKLGFLVETASDGQEGLSKFVKSKPGYYDVIYMDIQMPIMDGYEATVAIRASRHADAKRIPIIAITANVFMEDVEKAHIAGMDGHVGKPITTSAIVGETDAALERKRRKAE